MLQLSVIFENDNGSTPTRAPTYVSEKSEAAEAGLEPPPASLPPGVVWIGSFDADRIKQRETDVHNVLSSGC